MILVVSPEWECVLLGAGGQRGAAVLGIPWEGGPAIVGLDLVGLFPVGESVMGLVPERGTVVSA